MTSTRADLRRKICHLELEIERQEAALSGSRSLLRDLQASLAAENPTFPILTLPPEIASEIFVHCVPEVVRRPRYADAPFVLLRVCRAWNRIAMSTPALWTKIRLEIDFMSQRTIQMDILESMAKRAGQLPLTVAFSSHTWPAKPDAFWQAFSAHSYRIRQLEIVRLTVADGELLQAQSPAFPALTHLSLESGLISERESRVLLSAFRDVPLLRSAHFADMEPFLIPPAFKNLTNLVAKLYFIDGIMDVLRVLPKLLVLRYTQFVDEEDDDDDQQEPAHLVHKCLREIHLIEPVEDQPSVLRYLTLPELDILVFEATDPSMDTEGLGEFFQRSNPPLRRLVFHCVRTRRTLSVQDWDFLRWAPHITELEIDYPSRHTAQVFCAAVSLPDFLLELNKLVLRCRQSSDTDDDDYYDFSLQDEDEMALREFVDLVLDALYKRVVCGQVALFESRILVEDNDGVGLVSLSDEQVVQCREIKARGVNVWIGPQGRNLVI